MNNDKADKNSSSFKRDTQSMPTGGADPKESFKSESKLNVHDSKIETKTEKVDLRQSKIRDNDKGERKEEHDIGVKIDADIIPSQATATKSAINDSPSIKTPSVLHPMFKHWQE